MPMISLVLPRPGMMLGIASTRRALLFALNILDDNVHLLGRCCQADISSLRLLWPVHASYLTRRGVIPRWRRLGKCFLFQWSWSCRLLTCELRAALGRRRRVP